MRLEDVNDQEMRDLRELVSKLTLDNKSLSSKITGQKEQSKRTLVSTHATMVVEFGDFYIWYMYTVCVIVSTVVSCERNHANFNSQYAYKSITHIHVRRTEFFLLQFQAPSIHV